MKRLAIYTTRLSKPQTRSRPVWRRVRIAPICTPVDCVRIASASRFRWRGTGRSGTEKRLGISDRPGLGTTDAPASVIGNYYAENLAAVKQDVVICSVTDLQDSTLRTKKSADLYRGSD